MTATAVKMSECTSGSLSLSSCCGGDGATGGSVSVGSSGNVVIVSGEGRTRGARGSLSLSSGGVCGCWWQWCVGS